MVKKIITCLLVFCLAIVLFSIYKNKAVKKDVQQEKETKVFTAFFDTTGQQLDSNNRIKKKIAEITGAECDEEWLNGMTRETAINDYIAEGEYPVLGRLS